MIDAIAAAISGTAGCSLLDVDPGASTNRTVYTFVGSPDAVVEGALNAARQAFSLIDMSKHSGEHPLRMLSGGMALLYLLISSAGCYQLMKAVL